MDKPMEMDNSNALRFVLVAIAFSTLVDHPVTGQVAPAEPDTLAFRVLKWTPAEQATWIKTTLDKGVPTDLAPGLNTLIVGKSSLTLPLVEQKIEQVLQSKSPSECFTDKSVNPEKLVVGGAIMIAYAGNDEAMRQVAKLTKLDEKRFVVAGIGDHY